MANHVGPAIRFGFGTLALILLSIFASPALLLMALCAAPVILAFAPWMLVLLWKSSRASEHQPDDQHAQATVHARVVYSGPIDRLHAHAA